MSETPSTWLDFLVSVGAILSDSTEPEIVKFEQDALSSPSSASIQPRFTSLCHLGVIAVEGEEAEDG